MGVSSVCQTTVPHTFTQRTRESLVPVPSQPSTGHCPSSQIRQRMGRVPPAFPCPPGAEGVAVALGHLYFCEPTVPPSLVLCMAACLPVLPQQGMGGCPALYPAGMRNRSPSEIGWWGPGAGVCVCWGLGAGQGRGGLRPGVLLRGEGSVGRGGASLSGETETRSPPIILTGNFLACQAQGRGHRDALPLPSCRASFGPLGSLLLTSGAFPLADSSTGLVHLLLSFLFAFEVSFSILSSFKRGP